MRVLITFGSQRGGTEGIAQTLAEALRHEGVVAELLPVQQALRAPHFDAVDAVIIGGAVYSNRWHPDAQRFVRRNEAKLRQLPVWFFSSGPLDASADQRVIPPTRQVEALMERVGAQGHMTFGGRLAADARGFPASAMAKTHAGDWRRPERVRAWAADIARALPTARPLPPIAQPGHSLKRLVLHGVLGWALCAAVMGGLLWATTLGVALVLHALAVPIVFAAIAWHYFRGRGARTPFATAFGFVGIVALLDVAVVAGLAQRSLALVASVGGFWLPLALIFVATWTVGALMSMIPTQRPARA
jgi:menaquinone-dependent protoporphyrinogen oxidase